MALETVREGLRIWRPETFPGNAWFGVPTRRGGVSRGPYASLNLGVNVGDEREHVLRNRALLFDALGIPEPGPMRVRQVHGVRIVTARASGSAAGGGPEAREALEEADGIRVEAGDPWTAVSVADCAPVALVSRDGTRGALVHSGWRGTRDGIAAQAVRLLGERGISPSEIRVSIGPCIHACCYPVGPEVTRAFSEEVLKSHPQGRALDLPLAIARGLEEAGVPAASIEAARECTSCEAASFYSHRRDQGITGRHWALFRLAPTPR